MNMPTLTTLDVRPVEPKDRFDLIMSAYDALGGGSTLRLVLDHAPRCMYYTLRATRGEQSFGFEYREQGPEVWRVDVRKR